jgi:hypothetical protein
LEGKIKRKKERKKERRKEGEKMAIKKGEKGKHEIIKLMKEEEGE